MTPVLPTAMKTPRPTIPPLRLLPAALLAAAFAVAPAAAQTPPAAPPKTPDAAAAGPLAALAWVEGCWANTVAGREYYENWLPLRGGVLLGVSHAVTQGKTLGYEYLRFEVRPDGVYYIALPGGQKELAFKLQGRTLDGNDEIFTFDATAPGFPERIIYRRGTGGWMYTHVEGKISGEERRNIFPMRRRDCATGEILAQ
jgi:hypothetical protein